MVEYLKVRIAQQRRKNRQKIKNIHGNNKNVNKVGNERNFYFFSYFQDVDHHMFSA